MGIDVPDPVAAMLDRAFGIVDDLHVARSKELARHQATMAGLDAALADAERTATGLVRIAVQTLVPAGATGEWSYRPGQKALVPSAKE